MVLRFYIGSRLSCPPLPAAQAFVLSSRQARVVRLSIFVVAFSLSAIWLITICHGSGRGEWRRTLFKAGQPPGTDIALLGI
jgi:hypothetical protein